MVGRSVDVLELLLPEVSSCRRKSARQVATFLRLLSDAATPRKARSVPVTLERARSELEQQVHGRLRAALIDLLRRHLYAITPRDAFAWFGEPAASVQTCWSILEEQRAELTWLPGVPEPGESPAAVAARLLAGLERLGTSSVSLHLWRARLRRTGSSAREAEALFSALLSEWEPDVAGPLWREAAAAAVAESMLDRGAVPRARSWLEARVKQTLSRAPTSCYGMRLRRLLIWTRLLQGDTSGARAAQGLLGPWRGRLPSGLVELRERRPEWLALLSGKAPAECPEPPAGLLGQTPLRSRTEIGASVLAVFAFRPGLGATPLHVDVAPGLRGRVREWLRERDGAASNPAELEHHLVVDARPRLAHAREGAPLRGALGGKMTRSLALVPIPAADGEVGGWLRIELEHHLLPAAVCLERLAESWRSAALEGPRADDDERDPGSFAPGREAVPAAGGEAELGAGSEERSGPCAEVFLRLLEETGMKTRERHWWGFEASDGRARLVTHGGQGLDPVGGAAGGRRALRRALATAGQVRFESPDPALALHEGAASGVVLPLIEGGRLCGLFAVESTRRRDFRQEDADRLAEVVSRHGSALRVAQFREWHRARFGRDVYFDARPVRSSDLIARVHDFVAAGRARVPVLLCGPPGSGKRVVSRWLHFEGGCGDRPWLALSCALTESAAGAEQVLGPRGAEWLGRTRPGTLVLHHVHRLSHALQARLCALLEAQESGNPAKPDAPRLVLTAIPTLLEAHRSGEILPELAQRLDRLQLYIPPLAARREELPGLIALFLRRFAEEEALKPPLLEEEAVALLWRQEWQGNVRALENLLYKLVLLHRGETVSAEDITALAQRFRVELRPRIPSRHPHPRDLMAALQTTQTRRGTWNKSRAATYLGWDPDTLNNRLKEAHIQVPQGPPEFKKQEAPS